MHIISLRCYFICTCAKICFFLAFAALSCLFSNAWVCVHILYSTEEKLTSSLLTFLVLFLFYLLPHFSCFLSNYLMFACVHIHYSTETKINTSRTFLSCVSFFLSFTTLKLFVLKCWRACAYSLLH